MKIKCALKHGWLLKPKLCHLKKKKQTTDTSARLTSTWVNNLSDKPFTEAQEHLLAHGSNFMIIPRCPPKGEYIAAIEHASSKLN